MECKRVADTPWPFSQVGVDIVLYSSIYLQNEDI